MYGISTGVPWIWMGMGGEKMGFERSTSSSPARDRYWTPARFYSFGPRLDANIPLVADVSFSMGANLNRFREDQFAWGTGFLLAPGLIYGNREEQQIKLSYMRIESKQGSTVWSSDSFALTGQKSL
jgi:hypothetical protein